MNRRDKTNEGGSLPPESEWGSSFERASGFPEGIPEPTDSFQDALLRSTTLRVEARGTRRRLWQGAAALLLFGCGWWVGAHDAGAGSIVPAGVPASVGEELDRPEPDLAPSALPMPMNPRQLERKLAAITPAERPQEWLRAGNEYMAGDRADPSSALYCYRQGLEASGDASGAALEISEDDSWLLKALKVARR